MLGRLSTHLRPSARCRWTDASGLRQRAIRHKRSLEAEVRAILERAGQEAGPGEHAERFPDWFIRMTRRGIDLDAAIEEYRLPHEGAKL